VVDTLFIRKGASCNVVVFPESDYDDNAFRFSNGQYTFLHKAHGADNIRYLWNFGRNRSQWKPWEETTFIDASVFDSSDNFWEGQHILMQCRFTITFFHSVVDHTQDWSDFAKSASVVVHAVRGFNHQRRIPQLLACGSFNSWGYDKGVTLQMAQTGDGQGELEIMSAWPSIVQLNVFEYNDFYYGDVDGDGVLDRLPPNTAAPVYCNLSAPPKPHNSLRVLVADSLLSL
jgi:alpha-1,3-glucan synthase